MKLLKFLGLGTLFGIILTKGQVISWYKIYEMFKFQSFHMYGVIGSAVILGAIGVYLIKKYKFKSIEGNPISFNPKDMGITRYLLGGTIFGLGWAMTGACPGPMFALIGHGELVFGAVFLSATLGTFVYGVVKHKLPH